VVANPYILLLLAILIGVAGQLSLRFGMLRHPEFRVLDMAGVLRNWPVLMGFICYGLSTVLYLQVLARIDLSLAYPTVSLGYVLVIIMSRVLFKEPRPLDGGNDNMCRGSSCRARINLIL